MKVPYPDVEQLYTAAMPTGEPILDETVGYLRRSQVITPADLALLMDVEKRHLYGAIRLLTGLPLGDFITRWRLAQARDLLHHAPYAAIARRTQRLDAVARRCGWRSYRVMLPVARRYGYEL